MRVLGLDFETTGLEPGSDRVIEIGAVVWDTFHNKPVQMLSELIKPEGFIGLPEKIIEITGIDDQSLYDFGGDSKAAFEKLNALMEKVDFVVAHNAPFDRSFYMAEVERLGLDASQIKWLDTVTDVPYPESIGSKKLTYLAADHGILNPFSHRALFDTLTMLYVFSEYDVDQIIQRSESPSVNVLAHVSFEEKDKAKNLGFKWDGKNKKWYRHYKQCDLDHIEFPFEVTVKNSQLSL